MAAGILNQPPVASAQAYQINVEALGRLATPEQFADIVLKETVVKAASLAHGVRRGLAPAARNRIRFEMKQEVRRARKQRRSDLKAAQRDLHARQRAVLRVDPGEAS